MTLAPKPAKNTVGARCALQGMPQAIPTHITNVGACLHAITQHQTGKNNGDNHDNRT